MSRHSDKSKTKGQSATPDFPPANIIPLPYPAATGGPSDGAAQPSLPMGAFQKLERLLADIKPPAPVVSLHLGEPDGGAPAFIKPLLAEESFFANLGKYPELAGNGAFRQAVKNWAGRRFHLRAELLTIDAADNTILPTSGSREGLALAITYAVRRKQLAQKDTKPLVVITSPFYHVYHAAGLVAGADVIAIHCFDEGVIDKNHSAKPLSFAAGIMALPEEARARLAAIVICTPDNPTGRAATLTEMEQLHDVARRHDAVIISDECYSDLDHGVPAISFLNHADNGFGLDNIIVSNSLSKRSGVPGLRSGVLIADRATTAQLANLRSHLSAIPTRSLLALATALWDDDAHVSSARDRYRARARVAAEIIGRSPSFQMPSHGFFLYLRFADGVSAVREIFSATAIKLLPAIFMAGGDGADRGNPALGYVRLAMIAPDQDWPHLLAKIKPFLLPETDAS